MGALPADFQTWTLQKKSFTRKNIANSVKGNHNLLELIH